MITQQSAPIRATEKPKNLYIILSQTSTKVGKTIRLFAKQKYNHAAMSLEEDLEHIYAFARPQHNAILLGGLVQESLTRYTLRRNFPVPVAVYKVPVTEEEYAWVKSTIQGMEEDPDYIYNLFSVLSYPVTRGISVNKAFTCVEFVTYLLQHCGYLQKKACCHYKPDDLAREFDEYLMFCGDVRECFPKTNADKSYFAPFTWRMFWQSIRQVVRTFNRTCASVLP